MLKFSTLFTICFLCFLPAITHAEPAQQEHQKTIIHDQAEADMLLGKHLFGNRAISNGYPTYGGASIYGEATVTNDNGVYHLKTFIEDYYTPHRPVDPRERSGGYNKIDVVITEIHPEYFIFKGMVETALVERKPTEEKILEWVSEGETREEAESYRYSSTISDPIDPNHISVCIYPKDQLYKFSREIFPEEYDEAIFWRTISEIPKHCDRKHADFIDIFIEKITP